MNSIYKIGLTGTVGTRDDIQSATPAELCRGVVTKMVQTQLGNDHASEWLSERFIVKIITM
jgi:hypothetical protein